MTYEEAKSLLDSYATLGSVYGLDGITHLLEHLGRPDRQLKIIHVAGTNGKGSTVTSLANILEACGYRTATYTSPEVTTYLDRFRVSCEPANEESFLAAFEQVEVASTKMVASGFSHPTIFEMELAIAYLIALDKKVDIFVQETGLGGRHDATNIIEHPVLTVFTAIDLDHMQFLGDTVEKVAAEKAGIMKAGVPVVAYDNGTNINQVLIDAALDLGCPYVFSTPSSLDILQRDLAGQTVRYEGATYHYPLIGTHQIKNLALILLAVSELRRLGWQLPAEKVQSGLDLVKWPGRFEVVSTNPTIILDGAHNPQAAKALAETVATWFPAKKIHLLVHIFKDKDASGILENLAPVCNHLTLTTTHSSRSTELQTLSDYAKARFNNVPLVVEDDFSTALTLAYQALSVDDVLIICGSLSHLEFTRRLLKDAERI